MAIIRKITDDKGVTLDVQYVEEKITTTESEVAKKISDLQAQKAEWQAKIDNLDNEIVKLQSIDFKAVDETVVSVTEDNVG